MHDADADDDYVKCMKQLTPNFLLCSQSRVEHHTHTYIHHVSGLGDTNLTPNQTFCAAECGAVESSKWTRDLDRVHARVKQYVGDLSSHLLSSLKSCYFEAHSVPW